MEKIQVKIAGVSCGHRQGRNTAWLTLYALKAAEKFGGRIGEIADIKTELIDLCDAGKKATPVAEDGDVTCELMPRMRGADGFVFGSPVFTGSYTSRFITLVERMRSGIKGGYFTNKPAGSIAVASIPMGGQERCLEYMDFAVRALGMIPVHWLAGGTAVSGIPHGPLPGDDTQKEIGVKRDRFGLWTATNVGRRVAQMAVIQKMARRRLGKLYDTEFIQRYSLPFGDEGWGWHELDRTQGEYMQKLDSDALMALDRAVISKTRAIGNNGARCRIIGLGCDDRGGDTNWLLVHSLKAIEKFGRRVESVAGFETEFIDLTNKNIRPCLNCDRRYEIPNGGKPWKGPVYPAPDSYGCIIRNDYFAKEILPRIDGAHGLIVGSSTCAFNPSVTFRLFSERLTGAIWLGYTSSKPTANIAVGYDHEGGQESCLNVMNTCHRWVEYIPVSWPVGTVGRGGSPGSKEIAAKMDAAACSLSVINARRVAEFALMTELAKQEIGESIYKREFFQVIHPPHGEAGWEWSRLDKDQEDYMMSLTSEDLQELGR